MRGENRLATNAGLSPRDRCGRCAMAAAARRSRTRPNSANAPLVRTLLAGAAPTSTPRRSMA